MIVLLGSSYTRGAWGEHMNDPSAFVHTMLADALQCQVANMSITGSGSETFVDAYIHAIDKYNPSLFIAELVEDRSRHMMYLTNDVSQSISEQSAETIHDMSFQYGIQHEPYTENQIEEYRIHNGVCVLKSYDKLRAKTQRMFDDCYIRGHGHTLCTLLDWINTLNAFHHSKQLNLMRTIKHFMSLEKLSKIAGVPVLYYRYNETLGHESKLRSHINGRYLNSWHNINVGTQEWANTRMQGMHLADHTHLNKQADELVIKELMVPFIKHYATANNITL
jgi:hypothetical protein